MCWVSSHGGEAARAEPLGVHDLSTSAGQEAYTCVEQGTALLRAARAGLGMHSKGTNVACAMNETWRARKTPSGARL